MISNMVRPFTAHTTRNGLAYNYYKSTGNHQAQTLAVLVHANGFCKETWNTIIQGAAALSPSQCEHYAVLALDWTGHGDSRKANNVALPQVASDVWECVTDLRDRTTTNGGGVPFNTLVGFGHSFGASGLLQSAMQHPRAYSHLMLVEPILAPQFPVDLPKESMPMYNITMKRTREFNSRSEAFEKWTSNKTFRTWDVNVLNDYVEHGLKPLENKFVLKCDPETEAGVFVAGAPGLLENLDQVHLADESSTCELFAGEKTKTTSFLHEDGMIGLCREVIATTIKSCGGPGALTVVPDAGHLVLMEKPDYFAQRFVRMLARTIPAGSKL